MQVTGQNNNHNIVIRPRQEPSVSMVITRIKNPVMTFRLVLLQSIAGQFYVNCTIVITQTNIQLITLQSSLINIQVMCILKIIGEQCKYFLLLMRASIACMVQYHQSNKIMERLS